VFANVPTVRLSSTEPFQVHLTPGRPNRVITVQREGNPWTLKTVGVGQAERQMLLKGRKIPARLSSLGNRQFNDAAETPRSSRSCYGSRQLIDAIWQIGSEPNAWRRVGDGRLRYQCSPYHTYSASIRRSSKSLTRPASPRTTTQQYRLRPNSESLRLLLAAGDKSNRRDVNLFAALQRIAPTTSGRIEFAVSGAELAGTASAPPGG
jgi:hypothetical protein